MSHPRCWISDNGDAIYFSGFPLVEAYQGIFTFAVERSQVFLGACMERAEDGVVYLDVGVVPGRMTEAIILMQPLFERFGLCPPMPPDNPYLTATEIEQMCGALGPQRFREQYELQVDSLYPIDDRSSDLVELPRCSGEISLTIRVDTEEIDRAFRQIERGLEQVDGFLRGRSLEQWHQLEQLRQASRQLHRAIVNEWSVAGGRQVGRAAALSQYKPLVPTKGLHCCASCDYLMRGHRAGESHICNAFHQVGDIQAENECPDWE